MKTLVTFQFEVQLNPGQSALECFASVRGELSEWVRGIFRGLGVHDWQLAFDGSSATPYEGHEVQASEHSSPTHRMATLEWEFVEPNEPAVVWHFGAGLIGDASSVQVALTVHMRWGSFALRPLNVPLKNSNPLSTVARLRDKLLLGWKCRIEGQPIPTRARPLNKRQVDSFVREVLLNPSRVLPVVLFSLGGRLKMDLDALHGLQNHVLGLAHVAAVLDEQAAQRMAKLVGKEVYPPDAVMRVYWPGLLQEGIPQAHPYQTIDQLHQNLKAAPLPTLLMNLLAPVSAEQFLEGRALRAAYQAIESDETKQRTEPGVVERLAEATAELQQARHVQQRLQHEVDASSRRILALLDDLSELRKQLAVLRAAPARDQQQFDELAAELERAWDENKHLRTDWEAARSQLAELEVDFRNYLDSSTLFWEAREPADISTARPSANTGRAFATVADALRAAADQYPDLLDVWEDAEESAEQSLFPNPAKVFQALEAIAEVGRAYFKARNGGPPLGPMDRAFLSRVPFKYTCFESKTTLGLFGAERVFHHCGQSRRMQRHLTLGGGTTNNCLQIYFEFDCPTQRVVIGYCGRHLPYSSQRT